MEKKKLFSSSKMMIVKHVLAMSVVWSLKIKRKLDNRGQYERPVVHMFGENGGGKKIDTRFEGSVYMGLC